MRDRAALVATFLILSLAICGLLATAEELTNDSRKTAVAVRITFNSDVTIRSHGRGFDTVEPSSGQSNVFVFSGGEVRRDGSFKIEWMMPLPLVAIQSVQWLDSYGADEPGDQVSQYVVNFADPELEAAIRDAIGEQSGDIYNTDLIGLTFLTVGARNITNLEGIQDCRDLVKLNLYGNDIVDISPLVANFGLNKGDTVILQHNLLDLTASSPASRDIATLRSRQVSVFDESQRSPTSTFQQRTYAPDPSAKPDLRVSWEYEGGENVADGVYVNIEVKVENIGTGESSGTSCWFGMEEGMNWSYDQTDFREYDIAPNGWRRYTDSLLVPFGVWTRLIIIIQNDQGDYIREESGNFYTG